MRGGFLSAGLDRRLEGHMERGEELMQRDREAFDRNTEAFDQNLQAFDKNLVAFDRNLAAFDRNTQAFERLMTGFDRFEQRFDEQMVFMRDVNRRNEILTQQILADHEKLMQELWASAERSANKSDELLAEMRESREEGRAGREALLALIDRLPPPPEQP